MIVFTLLKTILERERGGCSVLFTNFTPENIFALLLTGLDQNVLALLPGDLLAVLLGHIKTNLSRHGLTDGGGHGGGDLSAHLFRNSLTFLVLDLKTNKINSERITVAYCFRL